MFFPILLATNNQKIKAANHVFTTRCHFAMKFLLAYYVVYLFFEGLGVIIVCSIFRRQLKTRLCSQNCHN